MHQDLQGEPRSFIKGIGGLLVAAGIVAVLLISLPAYRLFFLVSAGVGVAVAAGLYFWHKLSPIKEPEGDNKRPLGLE